jgi:hypothetical protein
VFCSRVTFTFTDLIICKVTHSVFVISNAQFLPLYAVLLSGYRRRTVSCVRFKIHRSVKINVFLGYDAV